MKKYLLILGIMMCLLLTGCSNTQSEINLPPNMKLVYYDQNTGAITLRLMRPTESVEIYYVKFTKIIGEHVTVIRESKQ